MADFFYQIKARQDTECTYSRWIWPPVFSGMVHAENKKKAREIVDAEYGQKFPLRVLTKDIESAHFLLNIYEVQPDNGHIHGLFYTVDCKQCSAGFRVIDHYNNGNQQYKGRDFCSDECRDLSKRDNEARMFSASALTGKHPPVIYKIENIKTGMSYIGKTTQPFTLRWWQHFFHGTDTKFHKAISDSSVADWMFAVVEVIEAVPEGMNLPDHIAAREQHWINQLDTIGNGYNSATARKEEDPLPILEFLEGQKEHGRGLDSQ